jgi:hypothetical protein
MPKYNAAKDVDPKLFTWNQGNIPWGYHIVIVGVFCTGKIQGGQDRASCSEV